MYGAVPAIFKNLNAVILAARGYGLEENKPYCVMEKMEWYSPVAECDIERAKKDGYRVVVSAKCLRESDDPKWDVVWDPELKDFKAS